jgi:hypothetical protein
MVGWLPANGASSFASPAASPVASPSPTTDLLATVQANQAADAASAAQTATALATQNAQLQAALVGLATSETAAKQAAADAQDALGTAQAGATNAAATSQAQIEAGQATIAAQATEIANLELSATANALPTATPTETLTPTATPTETPTPRPTATETPEPSPTPLPKAGDVLYRATTKNGEFKRWAASGDWKVLDGMLLNDGTECTDDIYRGLETPYKPGSLGDYAVEVQVQVVSGGKCFNYNSFGLNVRLTDQGWYGSGVYVIEGQQGPAFIDRLTLNQEGTNVDDYTRLVEKDFEPDSDWHTYRVEVQGNHIRLLIDGTLVGEATDNRFLEGGEIYLWCHGPQINVRSFKVIAL